MDTANGGASRAEAGTDAEGGVRPAGAPFRVHLPGFILEPGEEIGFGDVIKRATTAAGIAPCGGCAARAATLNRWLVFSGSRS